MRIHTKLAGDSSRCSASLSNSAMPPMSSTTRSRIGRVARHGAQNALENLDQGGDVAVVHPIAAVNCGSVAGAVVFPLR